MSLRLFNLNVRFLKPGSSFKQIEIVLIAISFMTKMCFNISEALIGIRCTLTKKAKRLTSKLYHKHASDLEFNRSPFLHVFRYHLKIQLPGSLEHLLFEKDNSTYINSNSQN